MNLQKNTILTGFLQSIDGTPAAPFTAEVSPCCYMHPSYGVQLRVQLACGGWTMVGDKSTPFSDCTIKHAQTLAESVQVCKCTDCENPAIHTVADASSRAGQCEKCFMAKLRAEIEVEQQKEKEKLRRKDAKMKRQGYTHRVDAWVHPNRGGDDFRVSFWMVSPTTELIASTLRKEGCSVANDFTLIEL